MFSPYVIWRMMGSCSTLWWILLRPLSASGTNLLRWLLGAGENVIRPIQNLCGSSAALGRAGHEQSSWFNLRITVRQGCWLSLILFSSYPEDILRPTGGNLQERVRVGEQQTSQLCFAHDIDLIGLSQEEVVARRGFALPVSPP